MQKLGERRLTDTPWDIPHVPCNCGLSLNSPEGRDSVTGLSTSSNTPDAALTHHKVEKGNSMLVFILNKNGKPLMPCHPSKARQLLRIGKAEVVKRTPFTIRLLYGSSGYKQPISLGVDSGYSYIGLSAVSPKQELYAAEITLRRDMVKLNSERRQYRRFRRYRKTWYRKPRFLNRKKPKGWLAPSIRNKLDTHIKAIEQVQSILPVSKINVEVASFDIQKIRNPEISGTKYQNGVQKGFRNVREYVLYRDGHKCVHCKGKSGDPVLEVHHKTSRQITGNRPDDLVTLCKTCHGDVSLGAIVLDIKPSKSFKAETFMSTVRWMLVNKLREMGNVVSHTYGYLTKSKRFELGLSKSHINDSFVIAGGNAQRRSFVHYLVKQVRKCNRKLFKGDRSHIRNTAPREVFGFRQWDKVLHQRQELFVKGRRLRGYFALADITGKLVREVSYKKLSLLERASTFLMERRMVLLPVAETTGCRRQI